MKPLKISAAGLADLALIHTEGIRLFGARQADKYLSELQATFDLIVTFPESNPISESFSRSLRARRYRSHIILYAVEEEEIRILRIRHAREDWRDE